MTKLHKRLSIGMIIVPLIAALISGFATGNGAITVLFVGILSLIFGFANLVTNTWFTNED